MVSFGGFIISILIAALIGAVATWGFISARYQEDTRSILKYLRALERRSKEEADATKFYIIQDLIIKVMFEKKSTLEWEDGYYQENRHSPNTTLLKVAPEKSEEVLTGEAA